MDMQMPVMDGLLHTRTFGNGKMKTAFFAHDHRFNAYALKEERKKASAGCDAHITNPSRRQSYWKHSGNMQVLLYEICRSRFRIRNRSLTSNLVRQARLPERALILADNNVNFE
jgi:CheY-like chemotaxis protein